MNKLTFKKYKMEILKDPRSKNLDFTPDGRIHYVYRISKDNKHYYGSRSESLGIIKESVGITYFTSSKDKDFREGFKSNPESFKIKIIKKFNNKSDKIIFESYLHQKFNVRDHANFINKMNQTYYGFDTTGRKATLKELHINSLNMLRYWWDPIHGEKRRRDNSIRNKDYWNDPNLGSIRRKTRALKITGKHSKLTRKINQIDLKTGNIIKQWSSGKEATDFLGLNSSIISKCANGYQKSAGGYGWEFSDGIIRKNSPRPSTQGSNHKNAIPILQICPKTYKVTPWTCIREAEKITGILAQNIGCCLNPKCISKTAGGFKWIKMPISWHYFLYKKGFAIFYITNQGD